MIGRDGERSTAASVLDGSLTGRGGVILIEGDGGTGKTRLLETVVSDALEVSE